MEQSVKRKIYQGVIFAVTFVVAFFGTKYLLKEFKENDKVLTDMTTQLNSKCPVMIDNMTRLDSVSVQNDNIFQYNYTLSIAKEDTVFKGEATKQLIKSNAQKNLNSNPEMIYFRDNFVLLKYSYKDRNNKQLFDFTIQSEKK